MNKYNSLFGQENLTAISKAFLPNKTKWQTSCMTIKSHMHSCQQLRKGT